MEMHDTVPVAAWATAHALGLLIAVLSRLALCERCQRALRMALSFGVVGVAAMALTTDLTASLAWVASASTLALMVVAAVWEPLHRSEDPLLVRMIAAHE